MNLKSSDNLFAILGDSPSEDAIQYFIDKRATEIQDLIAQRAYARSLTHGSDTLSNWLAAENEVLSYVTPDDRFPTPSSLGRRPDLVVKLETDELIHHLQDKLSSKFRENFFGYELSGILQALVNYLRTIVLDFARSGYPLKAGHCYTTMVSGL